MTGHIIFNNPDGRLWKIAVPGVSFSISQETMNKVIEFLSDYPEKQDDITAKINAAIEDVLMQEEYEEQVRAYWREKRS